MESLVADKNISDDKISQLIDEDGNPYEITQEAIEFGENLTVAMAKDIVSLVEEQKKKLLLIIVSLRQEIEDKKKEQSDIYYYLNKKLDDNFEIISSLEEQILNEHNDRENKESIYEKKIEELNNQLANEEIAYKSKIKSLEAKLDNLTDFIQNKEKIENQIKSLETTLELERLKFKNDLDHIEMKSIKERKNMELELKNQIELIKIEYSSKMNSCLDEETRNIRLENLRIKDEISLLSKEADLVRLINTNISERDRDLRIEYELSQSSEKELQNKLGTYQHLIKQLNDKNASLESKVEILTKQIQELSNNLPSDASSIIKQIDSNLQNQVAIFFKY